MIKLILIILPLAGFLFFSATFVLDEGQQAIVLQFGNPVRDEPYQSAGLHFKVPFIQNVLKFEKRIMEWDGHPEEIPTRDNKYIYIDSFARWQISDPLKFYKSARNIMMAQSLLDDIIDGVVRNEISTRVMPEIVRYTDHVSPAAEALDQLESDPSSTSGSILDVKGARLEIIDVILRAVKEKMAQVDLGIEVLNVQLKRIDYNKEVRQKLFNRMITAQNTIAEKYRAQGQGQKEEIIGQMIHKKKEIISGAYLKAQQIKGESDANAVRIYAESYSKSPDFFNFLETMNAYEKTIDSSTTLILSTDNPFLKYLGEN